MNIILLLVSIFVDSKTYFIIVIVINVIFNGTFMIICKWSDIFQVGNGIFTKSFGKLGGVLDSLSNMGRKNEDVSRQV